MNRGTLSSKATFEFADTMVRDAFLRVLVTLLDANLLPAGIGRLFLALATHVWPLSIAVADAFLIL